MLTLSSPCFSDTIARLFPGGVAATLSCGAGSPEVLFPVERSCIEGAAKKRREEFAAGRLCARLALSHFGYAATPILPGPDRAPLWPPGALGSISHSGERCVAIVGLRNQFRGLGIDIERIGSLDPSLWPSVFVTSEIEWLNHLDAVLRQTMSTVLFCAKEAFYKCQYQIWNRWLDFADVTVTVGESGLTICAPSVVALEESFDLCLVARFLKLADFVVVGVAITAS
jgi:enterobactin synthetase component D